jgi:hypothetical protein
VRNADAVEVTISALLTAGKLELPVDQAVIESARNLAAAVDETPGNANLWRQYREAVGVLYVDDSDTTGADELARLLGRLSPEVGDSA